jgi:hypothetical protein
MIAIVLSIIFGSFFFRRTWDLRWMPLDEVLSLFGVIKQFLTKLKIQKWN